MKAYDLARAFAEELNSTLTPEQMEEVNLRNTEDTDKSICHSHDFTDANQVMLNALARFGMDFSVDGTALINDAWDIAKCAEFSPAAIERDEREMERHG